MASSVSKRQQARNERALQELTKKVPGNDRCADCNAPNPAWASWNLGVFLCMRCAGLHRKLGTHISKVKSLSMDSWNTEQVENMKKIGNVNSNRQLNPRNVPAQIPVDADEADTAIEKHIRQKYEQRTFTTATNNGPAARQNTGSTANGADEPPPLPPKPGKHWYSLRSTSSTLPKYPKYDLPDAPISSAIKVEERGGKSGRAGLFGMRITSAGNNFDQKLNMLKEMGFTDARQNQDILKSVDGSLDRAVEILSRLNEDLPGASSSPKPAPISKSPSSGLKLTKTRDTHASAWEVRESKRSATAPLPPLPEDSQGTKAIDNTWNPFLQPAQQQQSITSSMQNLALTPNTTEANQIMAQQPLSAQTTGNPWGLYMQPQHAMSVPAMPMQPFAQASPASNTNPFYQSASPQSLTSSNPWSQQMTPQTGTPLTPHSNPFGIPWSGETPAAKPQNQHIAALNPFPSPQPQAMPGNSFFEPAQSYMNPQQATGYAVQNNAAQAMAQPLQQQMTGYPVQTSAQMTLPQTAYQLQTTSFVPQTAAPQHIVAPQQVPAYFQQPQQQQAAQLQGFAPQMTGVAPVRHDKSSIMALYNYPQMATPPPQQLQTLPEDSVSAPVSQPQGNNPFAFQQQQAPNPITMHASKESVDFQSFHQNGRQSPDAFAGLSSRFTR